MATTFGEVSSILILWPLYNIYVSDLYVCCDDYLSHTMSLYCHQDHVFPLLIMAAPFRSVAK